MDKYVINIHSKKTFWFSFCLFKLKIIAMVNKNKAQSFAEWILNDMKENFNHYVKIKQKG